MYAQKGLDADCNKLRAVGVAVLPDNAEKPFLLRRISPDNTSSLPMLSALSDLFSSLKKKICYNSKLLYLPISGQFPKCTLFSSLLHTFLYTHAYILFRFK